MKIAVVTGSRAEYGLLYWIMKGIQADPTLQLQTVVTGAHLLPEFGETVTTISADGFRIDATVPIDLPDDRAATIVQGMGQATSGFGTAFATLQPDLILCLGDRYEILCAATAALILRIPVAHLHGGELTQGAFDDAIRHAVTKLSHVHFAATPEYRERIIQMGEAPERVHYVGTPGLEYRYRMEFLTRDALESQLDCRFGPQNFLVTYHPVTLIADHAAAEAEMGALFVALEDFPEATVFFTGVNADPDHRAIARRVQHFISAHPRRAFFFQNLGQQRYLSLLQLVDVMIGNSSSGIIEAPAFGTPTVNIGSRQDGRCMATTIIAAAPDRAAIAHAITRALSPEFRAQLKHAKTPYDGGMVSERVLGILKTLPLQDLLRKSFHHVGRA